MKPISFRFRRRDLFRAGGLTTTAAMIGRPPSALAQNADVIGNTNVYSRIGVRPFINLTGGLTINGGLLTLPEVQNAMHEAAQSAVHIDELMEKVGERLGQLLGCEFGIVTAGCAAALTHATAACVAGGDPEAMQRLPKPDGLKDEVIVTTRNAYDHAIRSVGVSMIEVSSREELYSALGRRTAMIFVLASGRGDVRGNIPLDVLVEAARKINVPILVDVAGGLPLPPNPYLTGGADLVAYSGGKSLRGPNCAGLLLGRKDLVKAAWVNSSPHQSFGRPMKVGKEEIAGMLAAVEALLYKRDLQAERRTHESWLEHIAASLSEVPGIRTGPPGFTVSWDPEKIGLTAGELHRLLLEGEPRIMFHVYGSEQEFAFQITPGGMKPGEHQIVARRLVHIFRTASSAKPKTTPLPPATDVTGRWELDIEFAARTSHHIVYFQARGNSLAGSHLGRWLKGDLTGTMEGDRVRFQSMLPYESAKLTYDFTGELSGDQMKGEVRVAQQIWPYCTARWRARRRLNNAA